MGGRWGKVVSGRRRLWAVGMGVRHRTHASMVEKVELSQVKCLEKSQEDNGQRET